jgi:hypothetical protein
MKSIYSYVIPSIGGSTTLSSLTDTNIQNPQNNETLKYQNGFWINSSGNGLTSVGLSMPNVFNVANNPLTSNGTIGVSFLPQQSHKALMGDLSGNGLVGFRNLDSSDIPALNYLTSFNNRTGAITPTIGDYSLSQISSVYTYQYFNSTSNSIFNTADNTIYSGANNIMGLHSATDGTRILITPYYGAPTQLFLGSEIVDSYSNVTIYVEPYSMLELVKSGTQWHITSSSGNVIVSNGGRISPKFLGQISGITYSGLSGGDFLKFNGYSGNDVLWTNSKVNIEELSGVNINTPTNGQVLKYNGVSWINSTDTDTGLTSVGLSMPSIFNVTNSPLTTNGSISVNFLGQTSEKFLAGALGNSGVVQFRAITSGDIPTLPYLTSFNGRTGPAISPTTGDYSITQISGVSITAPVSGEILSYNGTDWTNISASRCLPTCEVYLGGEGTTLTTTLTTVNVWYTFSHLSTLVVNPSASGIFALSGSSFAFIYTGPSGKYYHTAASISSASNDSGDNYQIAYFRNGILEPGTLFSIDYANNNVIHGTAFHKVLVLNTNDIITLRMRNITASGRIISHNNINLVAMACCN